MELAGEAAESQGIDPGRPFVPEFGRRLYRAGVTVSIGRRESTWIAKKRRALFLRPRSSSHQLVTALHEFMQRLERTQFSGLVIDYDGTLCARDGRLDPLDPIVCEELNRLLTEGLVLGIASGRGRSVHQRLREAVSPKHWDRVVVGLYNGARVIELSDETPEIQGHIPPALAAAHARMKQLEDLLGFEAEVRPYQVSLRPRSGPDPANLRLVATEQLAGVENISIVMSSHSVDIVSAGTSKTAVVDALLAKRPECAQGTVLRIGDQGAAGGNDFELLNTGMSLSVDRVSSSLETCWNLGAPGLAGPAAALQYLRALRREHGMVHLDASRLLADANE